MSGRRGRVPRRAGLLVAAVSAALLTACSPGASPSPGATVNPTPSPTPSWSTPSPMPPSVSASTPGRPSFGTMPPLGTPTPVASGTPATVPASRWQAIEKDLAQRGVDATSARVVTAQAVTWNNGALGCPEPGGVYTQALVDGMQVIVDAGGTQYDYRFGNNDSPRLCERR